MLLKVIARTELIHTERQTDRGDRRHYQPHSRMMIIIIQTFISRAMLPIATASEASADAWWQYW